ncbi:MAG: phosphatidylserine decarboxylase [Sulfurimonadaceae bacterium]|nr:phosphatidylserine decarboxylase [Sulfurimonadaceae bacterium]
MEQSDTFIIAKEGWKFLLGSIGAFILFILIDMSLLQFVAFGAIIAFVYIYRNPERIVPYYQDHSIVAVADGRVRSIETVDNCPMLDGPCYKVEIVSGMFDTSLLRAPFEATAATVELFRGTRLPVMQPLASSLNERAVVRFDDAQGESCIVEHMLDQSIDALSLNVRETHKLPQGGRYGLMVRGTHTLYLPTESRVAVKVGEEVRAGESLIGYFSK